jgi:hypothetical protein
VAEHFTSSSVDGDQRQYNHGMWNTYAGLTGDTGWNDHDIRPSEGLFEPIIRWEVANDVGWSGDMTEV